MKFAADLPFHFDREAFRLTPPSPAYDYGPPTYLYLIQCEHFFKVGIASDPDSRCRGLQSTNPFPVKLKTKHWFESKIFAMLAERTVHAMLEPWAVGNEWFNVERRIAGKAITLIKSEMPFIIRKHKALNLSLADDLALRNSDPSKQARLRARLAELEDERKMHLREIAAELLADA